MVLHAPAINYHMKSEASIMRHCKLHSTCYAHYESRTVPAIKVATMKNNENFHYKGSRHVCYRQIDTSFTVSKDEWDKKEDTGKSTKNTLYVMWYAKRCVRLKQRQIVKKSC